MICKIFLTDLKHIATNLFAFVIIIGISVLPALYAWCNIYSNWDPYGNTNRLSMALCSKDQGYTDEDGNAVNVGEDLIKDLTDSGKIHWIIVDSEADALAGVRSGDYYGAVVVEKDFTYDMYHVFLDGVNRPQITFYQNQKKNAVATKISDTVMDNITASLDERFISILTETVFENANDLSDDYNENGGIDQILDSLQDIRDDIDSYEQLLDTISEGNDTLSDALSAAKLDSDSASDQARTASGDLSSNGSDVKSTQALLQQYSSQVDSTLWVVGVCLSDIQSRLNAHTLSGDVSGMSDDLTDELKDVKKIQTSLSALETTLAQYAADDAVDETVRQQAQAVLDTISDMNDLVSELNDDLTEAAAEDGADSADTVRQKEDEAAQTLADASSDVTALQNDFDNSLVPQTDAALTSLSNLMDQMSTVMSHLSDTLSSLGDVFSALSKTINTSGGSISATKDALSDISSRIGEAIEKVQEADDSEKMQTLIDTLSGDPDTYAEFFSEPVTIQDEAIYPVDTYGSAVAPFYTVLALWVGALISAAIMSVHPEKEDYPDAKPYQLYFGRLLTFLAVGELQALITYLGDLYLLHIQCVEPLYFFLACAITEFTFCLLLFSLVYTFGDVGKAIAVVIVVLQIAGSSGTYPIELLPSFFQAVYVFFPFPYAINAMRETIAGMYQYNYVIYLLQLSLFDLVSLAIGLLIYKPFASLRHYMERRMDDTGMM